MHSETRISVRRPLDDVFPVLPPLWQLLAADAALPHLADGHPAMITCLHIIRSTAKTRLHSSKSTTELHCYIVQTTLHSGVRGSSADFAGPHDGGLCEANTWQPAGRT